MTRPIALLAAALCAATFSLSAAAQGVKPSDEAKPAIGPRVGGSPADAEFRAVIQKTGEEFRKERTACRQKPREERRGCIAEAREKMKKARAEAKAEHDKAAKQPTTAQPAAAAASK